MIESGLILFAVFLGLLVATLPLYLVLKAIGDERAITHVIFANLASGVVVCSLGIIFIEHTAGSWFFYLFANLLIFKGILGTSWPKSLVVWLISTIIAVFFVLFFLSLGMAVLLGLSLPPV